VLANAGTGQVLAARDAHGWFRPASTLKVLTALALTPCSTDTGAPSPPARRRTPSPTHCPPLTEFKYAAKLLNWGFAVNGKVKPVGTLVSPLVSPLPATPATPAAAKKPKPQPVRHAARRPAAAGSSSAGPVAVGAEFLVATTLIVAGFMVHQRRAVALTREGTPTPAGVIPPGLAGHPAAGGAPSGSRPMCSRTSAIVC
jgi:D-alanyl-D-alanine carboxypeptidase